MDDYDTGHPLRDEFLNFLADLSEDVAFTPWCTGIEREVWRVSERLGEPTIRRHELFDWQIERIASFREKLEEWPHVPGYRPEDDASDIVWMPISEYAVHHAATVAREKRAADERIELLRAQPLDRDDMDTLRAVADGQHLGYPAFPHLQKLNAHGLVQNTGPSVWEVGITDEGQDRLSASAPRP